MTGAGVAAQQRCAAKNRKYKELVESTGSQWVAAVVERFGAVSGPLQGLFKQVAGEGERDPLRECHKNLSLHLNLIEISYVQGGLSQLYGEAGTVH